MFRGVDPVRGVSLDRLVLFKDHVRIIGVVGHNLLVQLSNSVMLANGFDSNDHFV